MRDKLIELIVNRENELFKQRNYFTDMERIEHTADYLIAHGVTLATDTNVGDKWIPVSEKYPEYKQDVLMYFDTGNMAVGFLTDGEYWSAYSDDGWFTDCDCFPLFALTRSTEGGRVMYASIDEIIDRTGFTNGDRIRAMTDEELAYWMTHLHEDGHCLNERCQIFQDNTCEECVIDWLKQPAKEET